MKVDNDNKDTKTINVKMLGVADGVDKTVVSDAKYTVKKADGTVIFAGKCGAETTTNTAITVKADGVLEVTPVKVATTSGSAIATKQLDAGTYTVIAEKTLQRMEALRQLQFLHSLHFLILRLRLKL